MSDVESAHPRNTDWFVQDRFGLFLHWGLYSLPARHEWVKSKEKMSDAAYDRYLKYFDPDLYDPRAWAKTAYEAGMRYFVITTKHHDGFCLWDSKLTDYKVTNTPHGKDLIKPMVEAFREQGFKVGFYHSLIDWHHPDYIVEDIHHPRRYDDLSALNGGRRHDRYVEYLHGQVRELLTGYGEIDVLWFDFSFPDQDQPEDLSKGKGRHGWESEKLHQMIRRLQPKILLNDRLDLEEGWDFKTPEQFQPRREVTVNGKKAVWEACQTFSGSWGYHRDESSWKSSEMLTQMLIDSVSKGGNLLLNVGPNGRGEFEERSQTRLRDIGDWMRYHSRSIYGCTQAPGVFTPPRDCRLTYNPKTNRLYVHLFAWPCKHLHLDGKSYLERVEYAQLLHDASEIQMQGLKPWQAEAASSSGLDTKRTLTLELPILRPVSIVPVIELFLK